MRERQLIWALLHRKENGQSVYVYDKFRRKQLSAMEKHGWQVQMRTESE